ncbi:MAG: hypothetical protein ACP5RJ_05575 [Conexivisphaera sp.]
MDDGHMQMMGAVTSGWSDPEEAEAFGRFLDLYRCGRIPEESFRRFRLQNGVYGERLNSEFCMVRVKARAGLLTPAQLRKLAEVSETFSVGGAHLTTRNDIQLHWVRLDEAPEVLRELASVGLTTREACGNTVRGIVVHPLAGVCRDEPFDVRPYAEAVAAFFLRNPLTMNLPRKFKINFSCCGLHGPARTGDIGVVPRIRDSVRGFTLYVGGGLGLRPYIGEPLEPFTPEDDLLPTLIAIIRLYDRVGDRSRMHRNRLRYLVHDVGIDVFREAVLRERDVVRATMAPSAELYTQSLEPPPGTGSEPPGNLRRPA